MTSDPAQIERFKTRIDKAREANAQAMRQVAMTLDEIHAQGLTSTQFDVFRRNYLYRSVTTIYSVAATVAAALCHEPPRLEVAARSLYGALVDELGAPLEKCRNVEWIGAATASHVTLLFRCLNTFSHYCYPELCQLEEADSASLHRVSAFTARFRHRQRALFAATDYAQTLGASYGQEVAAEGMLTMLWEHLFAPLFTNVPESKHRTARLYFDVHLADEHSNAEAEHGKEAWENLLPLLRDPATAERACTGIEASLALQSGFFLELVKSMRQAASETQPSARIDQA